VSGEATVLVALARTLRDRGRTLEALEALARARDAMDDPSPLLPDISEVSLLAVHSFNAHRDAGELELAREYAAALVRLVPRNPEFLAAALECEKALGRWNEVAVYARSLLEVDPGSIAARATLAEICKVTGDAEGEIAHRMVLALSPANPLAPLVRLRDLHDVTSLILCRPLTPGSEAKARRLLDAARALRIEAEPGSEWEGWEKHYRLLLDAVDLDAVRADTPAAADPGPVALLGADGEALDWRDLRRRADELQAAAVFFAAADEAYVDLYGRWYGRSVLKFSDVPCLVVIHVIGGGARLAEIAARVGVSDRRLVFAGDHFDAGAVTTAAYDAPPKGRAAKPLAHLQSVRFLRLGALLDQLERPVFVSDIDLLLQRGVADLLDRHAGDDLVMNENEVSFNAGSRFTANLLLATPGPAARRFTAFLAAYLDCALAGAEVTRWIDQLGLLLARQHLLIHDPEAKVGGFDTMSDINNVMYPSYQPHPFRFLSLFHGFDMASLEGVLG